MNAETAGTPLVQDRPAVIIDQMDAVLFDLDGVVYRGPEQVPGADEAIAELRSLGRQVLFVTNNASRSPEVVAEHLNSIGVPAIADDVVTSAQAVAQLLARRVPVGSKVLVVGSDNLRDEITSTGMQIVSSADDEPAAAVQGYDPRVTVTDTAEVAYAVQRGALWLATNTDPTRPTDRGLAPGAGSLVEAVGLTLPAQRPEVAGKPAPSLLREAADRLGSGRCLFVGDRLDTDIAGAHAASMPGILVLTGSHGKSDLWDASADERPAQVIADLLGLMGPRRVSVGDHEVQSCGAAVATVRADSYDIRGPLDSVEQQLDALWALLSLRWNRRDLGLDGSPDPGGETFTPRALLSRLDRVK